MSLASTQTNTVCELSYYYDIDISDWMILEVELRMIYIAQVCKYTYKHSYIHAYNIKVVYSTGQFNTSATHA